MRKVLVTLFVSILAVTVVFAGGIVTNTNQSAAYMRTLNRNASTDFDAAYFNPAGLTSLCDGIHIGLSNQSIFQTREVENNFPYLNKATFEGSVSAPLFPNVYAVWKKEKLAISVGFQPIGGGGSANFEKGLPSFELPVSDLKASLGTDYRLDAAFEGSSVYYGGQVGVSYKVMDMLSVALGGRYVMASNSYVGHLRDIEINVGGNWMRADTYFTGVAASATGAASSLAPLVAAGAGGITLAQAQSAGYLSAAQVAQLEGGLTQFGVPSTGLTINQVQGAYTMVSAQMTGTAAQLGDVEVDAAQKASGITPVVSVFLTPMEGLEVAMRYEAKTTLELENETEVDGSGMFPDGAKTRADIPAMFALGVGYQVLCALRAEVDLNYYFNKDVDWAGREELVDNGYEVGLALEYALNEKLLVSGGYSYGNGGATPEYQTDLSYSLKSSTIGLGAAYKIAPKMMLNVGALNTFYQADEKSSTHMLGGNAIPTIETYRKANWGVAVGLDIKL